MRRAKHRVVVTIAVMLVRCGSDRLERVKLGMSEAEVRASLGDPSETLTGPNAQLIRPRGHCGTKPVSRVLIWDHWIADDWAVFIDSDEVVACAEATNVIDIKRD